MKILLVDDDAELVSLLQAGLQRHGFEVDACRTAAAATFALGKVQYAAIVLDIGLPDEDGLVWLQAIRAGGSAIPVLLLTARGGISDRVTGLQAGADDYLIKPFAMEELVARVRALLRRPSALLGHRLALGNVLFDAQRREIVINGIPRPAAAREVAILEMLMRKSG